METATLNLTSIELDLLFELAAQGYKTKKNYDGHSRTDALDMVVSLKSKLNNLVGA